MSSSNPEQAPRKPPTIQQPTPQRIQQPKPQRLDAAPPVASGGPKVVQPTPQVLPQKPQSGSTILVSPRQRGNPVLASLKSVPWEYSDIPADYVMGLTTCGLFLSLKYHRLHPEYIYTRIRNLQGKYNLRILLTLVDISNHEDPLRELSKTSLVNNVTIILCWSATEVAHYLELYKSNENASFTAIKGQQASNYADRLVEFVTVPRSLNKNDAVALVANFGSLTNAINADADALGMIGGWGGVKVKRWLAAVEEPFRARKATKRGLERRDNATVGERDGQNLLEEAVPLSRVPLRDMASRDSSTPASVSLSKDNSQQQKGGPKQFQLVNDDDLDDDSDEEAMMAAALEASKETLNSNNKDGEDLSGGVAAALAKLRQGG